MGNCLTINGVNIHCKLCNDNINTKQQFQCNKCKKIFDREFNFKRHINRAVPCVKKTLKCKSCKKIFETMSGYNYLLST